MKTLICALFFASSFAKIVKRTGIAHDKGKKLYLEKIEDHYQKGELTFSKVTYIDAQTKKVIAILEDNFSKSPFKPDHRFVDYRSQVAYEFNQKNSQHGFMSFSEYEKRPPQTPKEYDESEKFKFPPNSLSSQGLSYFLSKNRKALCQKKTGDLNFILPAKMMRTSLKYYCERKKESYIFTLAPSNFFLRLIAPKVILHFEAKKGNLTLFKGPSNILDQYGSTQLVEINYRHVK